MKCPKCHFDNPADTRFCGKCGTQLTASEEISASYTKTLRIPIRELTRGSTFAKRYEVIEELGRGGMGKVYRVEDKQIKEEVALKLIKPEIAADENTIERFRNELKFARKVSHRNVCRMYDLSEEEGTHYITMEYVRGEDLKSTIRRMGQLSVGKAISIARQVCEGLAEAHRLGVVHRDLKSKNIMIDKEGNARIMDFGIARSLEAKGITDAGVMIGTPEYMSPEQVEGKEVDGRSDIYSLGVILYEMLTGRVPFLGDTPLSIALKHKTEAPLDPREVNAQIPEDLSHLILKCMEKDKGKRYQKAEEILSELSKIERGIPTTERVLPKRKPEAEKIGKIKWRNYLLYSGAAVLLILIIVGGIYLLTGRREAIDSIAVLPLENLSGDPEQEYFADGMTDALIGELAKIRALRRVISRTSVMQFKGVKKSLQEIAQELNVDAVIEGSVLLVGEKVRITAQLIEARTDRHLWADSYERDLRNILALQKELAQAIAHEIKIAVTPEEKERLVRARQVNPESYQLYLKGRWFWNKRTEEDLKKAIDYFEQAIELDSNPALAYAGLADSYALLPEYSSILAKEAYQKANEAALKALEMDDTLAEAHTSLAAIKESYYWDWEAAEREYKRAIELNSNYATAHHWYAFHLIVRTRFDEAIAEIERALELDPLSLVINKDFGSLFYYARQYDRAIEALHKTLEMDPNFSEAHAYLGLVYLQKSIYEEALAELQKENELSRGRHPIVESWIGIAYVQMGKRGEAQEVVDDLMERSKYMYVSSYGLACVYFVLGEKDNAFEWLEKAYEERDYWLSYLKIDPFLDSVRSDPRFIALLKKMGLEK